MEQFPSPHERTVRLLASHVRSAMSSTEQPTFTVDFPMSFPEKARAEVRAALAVAGWAVEELRGDYHGTVRWVLSDASIPVQKK